MRKILFILMLFASLNLSATDKKTNEAVTFVSYEQNWFDSESSLILKNNTDKEIKKVSFRIIYFDMDGNALDYIDYSPKTEIAPGMTRKIEIPAYGCEKNYSYYKSEVLPNRGKKFKINFELKDYKVSDSDMSDSTDTLDILSDSSESSFDFMMIILFFFSIAVLGAYIGMYILVAIMAKSRYRNPALWVLVSVFTTPLIAIIILLCIGKAYIEPKEADSRQYKRNPQNRWEDEDE